MSEAKHTPGPWHTGGTSHLRNDDPRMNVWSRTLAGNQSGSILAKDVRPADARLMASAPDLLAALKWCVENPGECLGDNPARLDATRASIAKAEGR